MKSNIFKIYEQTTSDDILKNLANFFWFCFVCCVLCGLIVLATCLPFWLTLVAQNSFGAEAFVRAVVFISTTTVEIGLSWTLFIFYMGLEVKVETEYVSDNKLRCKYIRNERNTQFNDECKLEIGRISKKTKNFEDIDNPTKHELVLFRTTYPDKIDSNFDYVFKHVLK